MRTYDFTANDVDGTCALCGAPASIVNGVVMHWDGWRDEVCNPSPADVH